MAKCPKCGHRLHLYDWKPDCPKCGVNMVYYNSNERLLAESEKAEIEHAKHQPGIDRAKASTIGSKKGIARIVVSALPLAAVFIPLVKLSAPDGSSKLLNALNLYTSFLSDYGLGNVFTNGLKGELVPLSIALLLVALVLMLVFGILLVMSLGKHGKVRNFILDLILVLASCGSAVCFTLGGRDLSAYSETYTSGTLFIGGYVVCALYLFLLIFNLWIAKTGIEVNYTTCLIGGIPSDEYFKMLEDGVSELEIRKKMVSILSEMQEEYRRKDAEARAKEEAEAEERRSRRKN